MNRKIELIIGSLILVLVIGFVGIKILGSSFDAESSLNKLEEALENKDINYLKKHIIVRGLDRDLDDQETKNIIESLDGISVYNLEEYKENPDANIYLIKKGRQMLFFDKYSLGLKPYKLTIEENYEGTKVFIDGKEVGEFETDDPFVYKDLLPGKHTIEIKYEGEYGSFSSEEEVTALEMGTDNEIYSYLKIEGAEITIESNLEEASLFIDGKDSGKKIGTGITLQPLPMDIEMRLKAVINKKDKTYESEEVKVSNLSSYESFYLRIEEDEEFENEENEDPDAEAGLPIEYDRNIQLLMEGYQAGLVEAVNNNSYFYIEDYIEKGSPFEKTQKKLIENLNKKNITEELVNYSVDGVKVISEDIVLVDTKETHRIYYKDGSSKMVDNFWTYTVVFTGDSVVIRNLK